jgi:hypothetical protein
MARKNDWLAASSFEQAHELASAINTISIHAKLLLSGAQDPTPESEIKRSRAHLLSFLKRLQTIVKDTKKRGPVVGADPHMEDLARAFLVGGSADSGAHEAPRLLDEIPNLVESEKPSDLNRLLKDLERLRSLVVVENPSEPVELAAT